MEAPTDRKYAETHEWFLSEGSIVTIGITQFAADELTDITFVELPDVGTSVAPGSSLGEVESVKATSEIYSGVTGEVIEVNEALADHPELVNESAFEEGWMVRVRVSSLKELDALMSADEYKSFVSN